MNLSIGISHPGWLPRSLRHQFKLILTVLALLIAAGSLLSVQALRRSAAITRQLAEERLVRMENGRELAHTALLIERETHHLLYSSSPERMNEHYTGVVARLDELDRLAENLGAENEDISVLSLYEAEQNFRNIVHIMVGLREAAPSEAVRQFGDELEHQAMAMVAATGTLAERNNDEYRRSVRHLAATADKDRHRVLVLFAGSLAVAWLFSRLFLDRQVLSRLSLVNSHLLRNDSSDAPKRIPVQGEDEIGEMARAVERFLEDRRRLGLANQELLHSGEMLRAIFEAAPTPIFDLDPEGRVSSVWNRAAEELHGWSAAEAMGRPYPSVPPEREDEHRKILRRIQRGAAINGVETQRIRRDGSPVACSLYAAPVYDTRGRVAGAIVVLVDITERKKHEARVRGLIAELERSNRELEQFAYVASHDLQEPLHRVAGFSKLLERRYRDRLDEKADAYIDYVTDGVNRMRRLINDLLMYSRVTSRGKTPAPIDCNVVVAGVLKDLQLLIEDSDAEIECGPLPTVTADQIQMGQLFQNLLGNAIKYRKGEPPRIRIRAERKGNDWLFSVQDNGIGLEREYAERIFVIFQRLHTRREYEGTGIGLAVCKKIVERHGGSIWIESEPGRGSTFFFTLPAGEDAANEDHSNMAGADA